MSASFDVIVLGGGMAGASVAAELAPHCRVLVLEVEDQFGRHATGRSAAMYAASYGNPTVQALTRASRGFFDSPPESFAESPLLSPRGAMFVADSAGLAKLDAMAAETVDTSLRRVDAAQALAVVPILRSERVAGAVIDESACDIDVASMHQGYLRQARRDGAQLARGALDVATERRSGEWQLRTQVGIFHAPVVVNATGAWADTVALRAGVRPIGLQPLRRTAVAIPAPDGYDYRRWPLTLDIHETIYFKPDAGQLLLSPANEDPSEPCDAMPDELDVAIAVDRFESLTQATVRRINHRWAGLRSFVADRSPVAGYDAGVDGFFWLAGQGGYGIQMAPALARAAAALILRRALPSDVAALGVTELALSPDRSGLRNP